MWSFSDRKIMDFCAKDAKRLEFKNNDNKEIKKQLREVLIFIKYNSISGKKNVNYGWFYGEDNLYPQVIDELKNRGFLIKDPVKERKYSFELQEYCPHTSIEINW